MIPDIGIAGLAALSALLIATGVLSLYWPAMTAAVAEYGRQRPFMGDLNAAVVALAGGREDQGDLDDEEADEDIRRKGIASEAHDFLGLSKARYNVALGRFAGLVGLIVALLFLAVSLNLIVSVLMGAMAGGMALAMLMLSFSDAVATRKIQQVRQFPFFLDIFLLIVQSNGNVNDAIKAYRSIFGEDELAQELLILQQDLEAMVPMPDAFDRLRNRIGNAELRNILGEMTHKLRSGIDVQPTLEQLANDMRTLREELGAQAAERLNSKFNFPVVLAGLATLLIFVAPAVAQMVDAGFL